jgi:imidazolonepropionase-like amidohydrolase
MSIASKRIVHGLAAAGVWLVSSAAFSQTFAVKNVRVFDGERVMASASVVIRDGRIEAVGPDAVVPAGIEVIDGAGKTLLPGMIDAHVHTFGSARRDAVRFGVTTQLDMFTDWHVLAEFKRDRESIANTAQSDVYSAGTLVTAKGGHGTQYGGAIPTLDRAEDAASFVDARIAEGSDFIKLVMEDASVYRPTRIPTLSDASVRAAIAAARTKQKASVVHVAAERDAITALEAGASGLAHIFQDQPASAAFVSLAKNKDAFVIATLTVIESVARRPTARELAADARLKEYLTSSQVTSLQQGFPPRADAERYSRNAKESIRRLHAAGVSILAGTDAGNPGTAHGVSIHEELALLVEAGLEPTDALAAATSQPARRFGLADRGRIMRGARADLVLVDGDPTRDVTASRAIVRIWKNGTAVDRSAALPKAQAAPATALISGFDGEKVDVAYGLGWQVTTDSRIGGKSSARIGLTVGGAAGTRGALEIAGEIKAGAAFAWGGAIFFVGADPSQTLDFSGKREIVFAAKGDGRSYQVMLFTGDNPQPQIKTFGAESEWAERRFELSAFAGADLTHLRAIAVCASNPAGEYRMTIDQFEVR